VTIKITIEEEFTRKLDQLGADAPKVLDRILTVTGAKYRDFVRRNYISGQMLNRQSGKLWKSVLSRRLRNSRHVVLISGQPKLSNIYEHPGGAVIQPKNAKALRFEVGGKVVFTRKPVRLAWRPFMSQSADSFPFGSTFEVVAERTFAKEFEKRGIV